MKDTKDIMDSPLRAVYGSLMLGYWNHRGYVNRPPHAIDLVRGYELRDNGCYPAAFEADDDSVIYVEIYDMSEVDVPDWETNLDDMDRMEKGAGYKKRWITTVTGRGVWMYVMDDDARDYFPTPVPTGNWNHLNLNEGVL